MAIVVEGPEGLSRLVDEITADVTAIDYEAPLREIVQAEAVDHSERLVQAVSPEGVPHPPLSPITIQRKGHDRILRETDQLLGCLQPGGNEHAIREVISGVTTPGASFGTRRPWAWTHQVGAGRIPQRKFLGTNPESLQRMVRIIGDHIVGVVLRGPLS